MKDIRPALRTFLLGDPIINGLVGGDRIHAVRLPQGQVEPSVVYTKISELGDYNMDGDSGLLHMRMQFDSWAQNADAATELANAINDRLSGASGLMGDINVFGAFLDSGRDDFDSESILFRSSRDYFIWYRSSDDVVIDSEFQDAQPLGVP